MLRIAYVGSFAFPAHNAMTHRVCGIASALAAAGFDVCVGAGGSDRSSQTIQSSDYPFSVAGLGEMAAETDWRLKRITRPFLWGAATERWLDSLEPPPSALLVFVGYSAYARRFLPWCRRRGIPFIADVVEWFQPSHLPGGRLGPFRLDHEWTVRHLNVQGGNVIAISSYLHHFYESKGCRVICIPPLFDVKAMIEPTAERDERPPLTIAYAGTPGNKDLLDPILEALLRVNATTTKVRFRLAGVSKQEVFDCPALQKARMAHPPDWIEAMGSVSSMQARDIVRKADFTVLLRPHLRYSKAGFPTKIAESLSLGTPVICNFTSDLAAYIRDGIEGVVCYGFTAAPFREAIERTLALGSRAWLSMRHNARRRAEECFDVHHYVQPLARFIEGAVAQARSGRMPCREMK